MATKHRTILPTQQRQLAWLVALAAMLSSLVAGGLWIEESRDLYRQQARAEVTTRAAHTGNLLESRLNATLASAHALATIARDAEHTEHAFQILAADLLRHHSLISALSLSPGGVISQVMPREGNEAALGFDQLASEGQRHETELTRDSQQLTVAGPLDLVQGGRGIVARLPVFRPDAAGNERFWGFANVTIRLSQLEEILQLGSLVDEGLDFLLWRQHPLTGAPEVIAASTPTPLTDAVTLALNIPNVAWQLSVLPRDGWRSPPWLPAAVGLAAIFSLLLAFLAKTFIELRWYRSHLSREVAQRTEQLRTSLQRYRAYISCSGTGAWEFTPGEGKLVCSAEYFEMLGYKPGDLGLDTGDNALALCNRLIHPDDATRIRDKYRQYRKNGCRGTLEVQMRLRHRDGHWISVLSRGRPLVEGSCGDSCVIMGTHIDISGLVNIRAQLKLSLRVLNQVREGVLIASADQRILAVNRAFEEITGYSRLECLGRPAKMLSEGMHTPGFLRTIVDNVSRDGFWQGEVWSQRKCGKVAPMRASISQVLNEQGSVSHYIGVLSDISQLKQSQAEVQRLAYYDSLTGLPNRAMLEERAEYALKLARHGKRSLAVMLLDLDNFKNINDSLGHETGDRLLQRIAARLRKHMPEENTLCRLGGDEFALLLPDTDASEAAHYAQDFLREVGKTFSLAEHELSLTCSIGIAMFPGDGDTLKQLHTNADTAMYRAKQRGRNRYSFYTSEMQALSLRQLTLENALRRAIDAGQLQLYYQPQQDLHSGALVGAEALLRWEHPVMGRISPSEFIPIAEDSGLILPIGEMVLRQAARQIRDWLDAGIAPPRIAINLSAIQFHQPDLPQTILSILDEYDVPSSRLELELTESMTMEDPEQAASMIHRLHEAGVSLTIDDFGTGYSSMSKLKHFRISKLKIDKSFVRDIVNNTDDRVIVGTVVSLAHSLGLRCVAEGVETHAQKQMLHTLGCDHIQGFHFGRPMSAARTGDFLRRQDSPGSRNPSREPGPVAGAASTAD
ncbi:bifunctional diguanylate cyclase/phosphodiesterase [Parahaliea mediterranea]|uniref:cyclic-guanylate-specific phosphodiesterase n=1 Tax=Parahaliea mediterranea TaxID=651086 RepID=A0A939IKW7_9GAMM|nr:EAL domain-containing protein [Parahaliea mediterranea]MBN7795855.1 EAL domain-containing protein [Parahaliea mediterranea]